MTLTDDSITATPETVVVSAAITGKGTSNVLSNTMINTAQVARTSCPRIVTVTGRPVTVKALTGRLARVSGLCEYMLEQHAPGRYVIFAWLAPSPNGDPRGARGALHDAMQDIFGGNAAFEIILL